MNSEQCTYSPDTEAVSLQTSSLDIGQLSLLSGMSTPAKSSESAQAMDGSLGCECGRGMCDCSIHPSTRDKWIAYMRDSLARTLALPENKQALELKRAVACTAKLSASLGYFDRESCSLKMSQQSLLTGSNTSLQTLPRSGMTRNGYVYELPIVGRLTKETGGFVLPTPTAHDAKKGAYPSEYNRNTPGIAVILGGRPAPTFQEWQMGWPINHSALKGSEMGKSHCKPLLHGESLEGRK